MRVRQVRKTIKFKRTLAKEIVKHAIMLMPDRSAKFSIVVPRPYDQQQQQGE